MSLEITLLTASDASELAALVQSQPADYMQHFNPFPFDAASLAARLDAVCRDYYRALRVDGRLAGFFMLRGLDEGYERPAFGVFVAKEFSGRGLGRKALQESLSWAREQQIKTVILKVHPEHKSARAIYEGEGFVETGVCERTGYTVMEAQADKGTRNKE